MEMSLSRRSLYLFIMYFHQTHLALFHLSQVVIMLGSLVIIFTICWTPRSIEMLLRSGTLVSMDRHLIGVALKALTLVNNMINPTIYSITSE